jgi:hypothetical protein
MKAAFWRIVSASSNATLFRNALRAQLRARPQRFTTAVVRDTKIGASSSTSS